MVLVAACSLQGNCIDFFSGSLEYASTSDTAGLSNTLEKLSHDFNISKVHLHWPVQTVS